MDSLPHLPHPPEHERDWHQALMELARYLRSPHAGELVPFARDLVARTRARD